MDSKAALFDNQNSYRKVIVNKSLTLLEMVQLFALIDQVAKSKYRGAFRTLSNI